MAYNMGGGISTGPSFMRPKPLGYDNGMSRTINQGIGGGGMTGNIRRNQTNSGQVTRRPMMGGMMSRPPARPAFGGGGMSRPGIPQDQPPMSSMPEGPISPPSGMMGGIGARMPSPMPRPQYNDVSMGGRTFQPSSGEFGGGGFGGGNEQGGGMWDRYARMLNPGMGGMNPFGNRTGQDPRNIMY